MPRVTFTANIGAAGAALALGLICFIPSTGAADVKHAARHDAAPRAHAKLSPSFERAADPKGEATVEPVLMRTDNEDVDGDGKSDTIAYFDIDGDGTVDSEVIDLGSTGTASIVAIRCDADHDGRKDDWLVVDAVTNELRATLLDTNDDGEADKVKFLDGGVEAIPASDETALKPLYHF